MVNAPDLRPRPIQVARWYEENRALFGPPICNKLMHKDQMTVMFVGGPNTRTDFHLDLGSEFFYQIRGNMQLPTIQRGRRKVVDIKEGQVFLLPSRIPHSPQRPEEGALGLVIERARSSDELDGLRWYRDFDTCDEVLYERFFHCEDLGRDLVPVVKAYMASEENVTRVVREDSVPKTRPWEIDGDTEVPDPFDLKAWLHENREYLSKGGDLNLFEGHPDGEFTVRVVGGPYTQSASCRNETFVHMLHGEASVRLTGREESVELVQDSCYVIDRNTEYSIIWKEGSIGMIVTQDPLGNKATR